MVYVAHIREKDKEIQSVKEHLIGVKKLSESFGEKLKLKHVAGLAGLLHDLGKYSDEFQHYINKAVFEPETLSVRRGEVDHSTAGGKLLFSLLHDINNNPFHELLLAEVVSNAIISHHSNLHDFISPTIESDFLRRVKEKELSGYPLAVERFFQEVMSQEEFREYVNKAVLELERFTDKSPTQSFFLSKFIFSCLIDADRTDTRMFEEQSPLEEPLSYHQLFDTYYQRLMKKLQGFKNNANSNNSINVLRQNMSEQCEIFAEKPSGIYTLSIPTGGGKTLASLRYALTHARKYNKQRIIYIVPFTTIIEQNAQEIRTILEDDIHILEHHSNVIADFDDDEQEDGLLTKMHKLKLARDNWDSPIIFTTMVQFLNVFYAKGNRNTRRLHNLSHAVLIFDEVQKVPTKCVSLFNESLNFLKAHMNSSILLCTATQPTLEEVRHSLLKNRDGEIVSDLPNVSKAFKRVNLIDKTEVPFTNEVLADWIIQGMNKRESTLVILNTKTVVKNLYEKLKLEGLPVYHLSTSMSAAHRKDKLKEIKNMLAKGIPIICVTTQIIEAGVDVSFKCVIRSKAGLDSIAQAAGRCNRHGEYDMQNVYVIDHVEENLSKLQEIEVGKDITSKLLAAYKKDTKKYEENLLSEKAMKEYFLHYYSKMEGNLNYHVELINQDMTNLLMAHRNESDYVSTYRKKFGTHLPLLLTGSYKTAAEHFQVIDNVTTPVIVPYGEGKDIIAHLNSEEWTENLTFLLKKAQQYTVSLYANELATLKQQNAIVMHLDGAIYELRENWYSNEYGVDLLGEGEMGFVSF
ncbi:CRISPR-associated helicase Cas3' [Ornithinibacillus sp. FSL M8-0202]|uniref:CRISPR-associated helicase Cas3' n=1 Tax=Ornithinibacillus sp. FSL M8-0202 TaxID=2921616 RepID=UPI0030D3B850